jgi:hypothetical protein
MNISICTSIIRFTSSADNIECRNARKPAIRIGARWSATQSRKLLMMASFETWLATSPVLRNIRTSKSSCSKIVFGSVSLILMISSISLRRTDSDRLSVEAEFHGEHIRLAYLDQ